MSSCRIITLCSLLVLAVSASAAKLQSIVLKNTPSALSLHFTIDKPIAHKAFMLTNPDRIVVDFENTELALPLDKVVFQHALIKKVRSGHPTLHTLRLVFEVNHIVWLHPHPLVATKNKTQDFALDLAIASLKKAIKKENTQIWRDVVIVLDPGHGGKDPGAKGPHWSVEKEVTLNIAKKLQAIINKQAGMKAVLTRDKDVYLGLRERLTIARKQNADVFISIHADAFIHPDSNGASVFALSQRGATSEAARWLAEKENYSELGGVNLKDLDDQEGLVRTVLIDLSQTATIGASLHMGKQVLQQLQSLTRLHSNKVEQARFMVLKSPDIPSILIETGFISNPKEEKNLTNSLYQQKLTQAIFQGLQQYFWHHPPHGTKIEKRVMSS